MSWRYVMTATPTLSGDVWCEFHTSYLQSVVLAAKAGWAVHPNYMMGNSLIPFARCLMGQDFMDSECECLFFLDSDLAWDPEAFVRLLEIPLDVVAGAYPLKKDGETEFHIKLTEDVPKPDGRKLLVDTKAAGGGFIKITRTAIEKMQAAYPELKAMHKGRGVYMLWDTLTVDGIPMGEDYAFCERWRKIGGTIYVDPDIDFRHYGHKAWEGNFLRDVIMKEKKDGEHHSDLHGQWRWDGDGHEHGGRPIREDHHQELNRSDQCSDGLG
jgi:hypothetical protein